MTRTWAATHDRGQTEQNCRGSIRVVRDFRDDDGRGTRGGGRHSHWWVRPLIFVRPSEATCALCVSPLQLRGAPGVSPNDQLRSPGGALALRGVQHPDTTGSLAVSGWVGMVVATHSSRLVPHRLAGGSSLALGVGIRGMGRLLLAAVSPLWFAVVVLRIHSRIRPVTM